MKVDAKRYEKECQQLGEMAKNALNSPKNSSKERFEYLGLTSIVWLLGLELDELYDELYENKEQSYLVKIPINFKRAREELTDVAACCVGLLAKLNDMEQQIADECNSRSLRLELKGNLNLTKEENK